MGSNLNKDIISDSELGVIPNAMKYLFERFKNSAEYEYITSISLLEIYNEEIIDLLNIKNPSKPFTRREDKSGHVIISGLTEISPTNSEEALK